MKKILITGIGFISQSLGEELQKKGYEVRFLTRNPNKHPSLNCFHWDLNSKSIDHKALEGIDTIIHLAGAGISDHRWTSKYKNELRNSRIDSTRLLYETIAKNNFSIKQFIGASAIGYYGTDSQLTKCFNEQDKPGDDFLAELCVDWENEINKFNDLSIRTSIIRTGVVFGKSRGAFEKIASPIKKGFGAVLGSGKQIIPWIHISDLVNIYLWCMDQHKIGIYNAVAPTSISNKELTFLIADKLQKKIWLPNAPVFVLKIVLGEMSTIILNGNDICSTKLTSESFAFKFPNPDKAIEDLL